ncbi:MAG: tetratricopeptide repeat protein [Paracoccaceae bacterium]
MASHSTRAQIFAGTAAFGVLALALLSGGPQAAVTLTPDTVVASLGGGPVVSEGMHTAILAQRASPDDLTKAMAAAQLMIAEGRAKGDSRLVGAALGIVQPFVQRNVPEAQFIAAQARQYQHDFPGALALLDAVIANAPTDVNALLNRATIHTVMGDYPTALADCTAIADLRADVGFLCQATVLVLTEHAPQIAERLSAILEGGLLDVSLVPWATSLLGEIAMMQGNDQVAEQHFRAVLAQDPGAQRDQLMLADVLLGQGRAADVTAVLKDAPDTDGVLVRRVLAARAMGQDLPDVATILSTRAQRSVDLELSAHAREEAMYFLFIAKNPAQALERAQANWALQHEFDDARLLIMTADAAGKPEAALPVLIWMQAHSIVIPALKVPTSVTEIAARLKP